MIRSLIPKAVFYLSLLVIWYILYQSHILPDYIVPSPLQVAEEYVNTSGKLLSSLAISMQRLFIGLILSLALGFALGYTMVKFKIVHESIGSLIAV